MENYIHTEPNVQPDISNTSYLKLPNLHLPGFTNTSTEIKHTDSDRVVFVFKGTLDRQPDEDVCPYCGKQAHVNAHHKVMLHHLGFGFTLTRVEFEKTQFYCEDCHKSFMQDVPFQAKNHRITTALEQYAYDLLANGHTLKDTAEITGLGKNMVKSIDKKRLQDLYTIDGKTLTQPKHPTKFLGIDEFKLHDGYCFATHIIDLDTGHVLWIEEGKKKQVVYDFIDHVGMEWMGHVEAVACDMNSNYQDAFEERCEWIQIVFDHFHIVKNFNEKVVSEVRKDEQRRLLEEGNIEAAEALKKTRYILTSNRSTLQQKDEEAREGKTIRKGSELFQTEDIHRHEGYEAKYNELLKENKLLFTIDLVKEKLANAYTVKRDEVKMAKEITEIINICNATENKHLMWFARLLLNHFEGIIAHATYAISSGKIEGINNKIKVIRRKGYGYPDDEYFFLKIIDASHKEYVRNPKSHRICD